MSANLTLLDGQVESVTLLGSDSDVDWSRDAAGLHIKAPANLPSELANVWKVTVAE
jgi:alpha-L-fucosidase